MENINVAPGRKREIDLILRYLKRERNLDFSGYSASMVERRIGIRLNATGASDMTGYLLCLEQNPGELDSLLNVLSINVSEFFRDPLVFDYIEGFVIPALVREKVGHIDHRIRIWSAGCASGEEPYSMAILMSEEPAVSSGDVEFRVFGTDIDRRALSAGEKGSYPPERMGNVRFRLMKKYFRPADGMSGFDISREIRNMVGFSFHDLASDREMFPKDSVYGNFDIALCRNVLIYLDKVMQAEVLGRLERAIRPGGFLVLGEAECLDRPRNACFRRLCECCKVYRKNPA